MMIYATITFWLLVVVFSAYGIYQLWSSLIKPKIINVVLLPGTLVAQLGRVIGLLVTGGTVNNTALIKNDDTGEPTTAEASNSQIPFIGPIVVALLPMLACGFSIYLVMMYMGSEALAEGAVPAVSQALPTTLGGFWDLLRSCIDLVEDLCIAATGGDYRRWQTWLFAYLAVCLTVRMAPLPGTQRGAVGAILILGGVAALISLFSAQAGDPGAALQGIWGIMSFAVALLLLLLIVSLVVRGGVGLFRILANRTDD